MMPALIAIFALFSSAVAAQSMLYAGERGASPESFRFTAYEIGSAARVAVHDANLRATSTPGAPVINVLSLGTEVKIVSRGEPVRNRDRVDRWYRVETALGHGYLFGNTLGQIFISLDVDGDGRAELASVTLSAKFSPVVRVLGNGVKGAANVRVRQFGKQRGGAVTAKVLKGPKKSGLLVSLCSDKKAEACRTGAVLVDERGRVLGSGSVSGGLEVPAGFRYGGIWLSKRENLWAPSSKSARLNKAPCALPCSVDAWVEPGTRAVLLPSSSDDDDDEAENVGDCKSIGTLVGGVLSGKVLVGCVSYWPNKPPPALGDEFDWSEGVSVETFVVERDKVWIPIRDADFPREADAVLQKRGIKLLDVRQLRIAGLAPPDVLRTDSFGSLMRRTYTSEPADGPTLYVDAVLGPVRVKKHGAFVPHPGGGSWRFEYDDAPGELSFKDERQANYKLTRPEASGPFQVFTDKVQGLERVGTYRYGSRARPVMAPTSADHPLYKTLNLEKLKDPHSTRALIFVEDDLGRTLGLRHPDTFPVLWAEPIVYLYPTRARSIVVRVPSVDVTASLPPARDNAWTVRAHPSGALDGVKGDRLFWEGTAPTVELPARAHVVARADARDFLAKLATAHSLNARERDEFVDAWAARLQRHELAQVRVVERDVLDRAIPLEVDPAPDSVIRLYIHVRPHDAPVARAAWPAPPTRRGFVVVEWGGAESY